MNKLDLTEGIVNSLTEILKWAALMFLIIIFSAAWGMSTHEELKKKDIEQSGIIQIDNKFYRVTEMK